MKNKISVTLDSEIIKVLDNLSEINKTSRSAEISRVLLKELKGGHKT